LPLLFVPREFGDQMIRATATAGSARVPSLREYRYIERDNRTYVIEPRERTIIEEID
jgi:hypothetical protein